MSWAIALPFLCCSRERGTTGADVHIVLLFSLYEFGGPGESVATAKTTMHVHRSRRTYICNFCVDMFHASRLRTDELLASVSGGAGEPH